MEDENPHSQTRMYVGIDLSNVYSYGGNKCIDVGGLVMSIVEIRTYANDTVKRSSENIQR